MRIATFVLTVCADDLGKLMEMEEAIVQAAGSEFLTLPPPEIEELPDLAERPMLSLVPKVSA